MRKTMQIGRVQIKQLPADQGYETLQYLQAMLNRINAKSISDVMMQATPGEIGRLYDMLVPGCTVGELPLDGNEDDAFDTTRQMYGFLYHAAHHNFQEIWEAECAKLDHSPEFTPSETKWLAPFFSGVIVERLATMEQIEAIYSVVDIAKMNEALVVQANNEHRASKQAQGNSSSSFNAPAASGGGWADAFAMAQGGK